VGKGELGATDHEKKAANRPHLLAKYERKKGMGVNLEMQRSIEENAELVPPTFCPPTSVSGKLSGIAKS